MQNRRTNRWNDWICFISLSNGSRSYYAHDNERFHCIIKKTRARFIFFYTTICVSTYNVVSSGAEWKFFKAPILLGLTLTQHYKCMGLQWCNAHRKWTNEWHDILFLNKSPFFLHIITIILCKFDTIAASGCIRLHFESTY